MKIIQVIHGFPPYNMAGSEVYTYNLSRELAKSDEVHVFHRIADPKRKEYETRLRVFDGLKVCMINNTFKYCDSFEKTYKNDTIAKIFGSFLNEVKPDIVHFGHVTCLSTSLIEEAKTRKIPLLFTLHDFWLYCQLGQLLKRDLSLCSGPIDSECARCLAPELAIKGLVGKASKFTKMVIPNFQNSGSYISKFLKVIFRHYAKVFFLFQKDAKAQIRKRTAHIQAMCSLVDVFIAPSTFLMGKYLEFGIPKHKIIYYDYGFNLALFNNFSKVNSQKTRFGYIGTFIPSKGVHVLLEAFNSIASQNAELRIHGKFLPFHTGFENYPGYLRLLGKKNNIFWFGEYNNEDIARILSEIDILVVPSIWYENSPLTIHESFMARVPVITANIGGMAELVQDGVNGLLFHVGDDKDLGKKIQLVIEDPDLIERLRKNIKPVIPIKEHALEIRKIYYDLVSKGNHPPR